METSSYLHIIVVSVFIGIISLTWVNEYLCILQDNLFIVANKF